MLDASRAGCHGLSLKKRMSRDVFIDADATYSKRGGILLRMHEWIQAQGNHCFSTTQPEDILLHSWVDVLFPSITISHHFSTIEGEAVEYSSLSISIVYIVYQGAYCVSGCVHVGASVCDASFIFNSSEHACFRSSPACPTWRQESFRIQNRLHTGLPRGPTSSSQ